MKPQRPIWVLQTRALLPSLHEKARVFCMVLSECVGSFEKQEECTRNSTDNSTREDESRDEMIDSVPFGGTQPRLVSRRTRSKRAGGGARRPGAGGRPDEGRHERIARHGAAHATARRGRKGGNIEKNICMHSR